MKTKLILTFLFASLSISSFAQRIILSTQNDVDNWPASQVEALNGLTISGANITNLDALIGLVTVRDTLKILDCPNLIRADLSSLTTCQEFTLLNADRLKSIDLPITGTTNYLEIGGNDSLLSCSLSNYNNNLSYIFITDNSNLTDLYILGRQAYFAALLIRNNPNLVNLGLHPDGDHYISDFVLMNNDKLVSTDGLIGSKFTGFGFESLAIVGNDALERFSYPSCSDAGIDISFNDVIIRDNPILSNFEGIDSVHAIGSLDIINNSRLKDVKDIMTSLSSVIELDISNNDSLESIEFVELELSQTMIIKNNPRLTEILEFGELIDFVNNITIEGNSVLTNIEGFRAVNGDSIKNLVIKDNPSLSFCHITSVCDMLDGTETREISGNALGCQTEAQVQDSCNRILGSFQEITMFLDIYPNPARSVLQIIVPAQYELEIVRLFDANGKLVLSSREKELHIADLSPGLYTVKASTKQGLLSSKLSIIR